MTMRDVEIREQFMRRGRELSRDGVVGVITLINVIAELSPAENAIALDAFAAGIRDASNHPSVSAVMSLLREHGAKWLPFQKLLAAGASSGVDVLQKDADLAALPSLKAHAPLADYTPEAVTKLKTALQQDLTTALSLLADDHLVGCLLVVVLREDAPEAARRSGANNLCVIAPEGAEAEDIFSALMDGVDALVSDTPAQEQMS